MSFVEFDTACGEKFRNQIEDRGEKLYLGDQANSTFLRSIVQDHSTEGFDIIIDDGGHTMVQQQTSLKHLWPAVNVSKPVYPLEELKSLTDMQN